MLRHCPVSKRLPHQFLLTAENPLIPAVRGNDKGRKMTDYIRGLPHLSGTQRFQPFKKSAQFLIP